MPYIPSSNIPGLLRVFAIWCALAATACGGQVDSDNTPGSGAGSGPTAGSGSGSEGSGGSASASPNTDTYLLGDCIPGFSAAEASTTRPCKYFIGTTCYSKQKQACACACSRDQGPQICIIDGNSFLLGTDAYGVFCVPE